MRFIEFNAIFCLIAAATAAPSPAANVLPDTPLKNLALNCNVLVNPDFSNGLNGWANVDWLPTVLPAIDTTESQIKGGSSLEFVGENPPRRANVYQDVSITDPGSSYYLSGWVKAKAMPPGWLAGLQVEFLNRGKWLTCQTVQTISAAGDWGWNRLDGVVTAPVAATTMRVEVVVQRDGGNSGAATFGAVWFSGISAQSVIDQRKPAAVSIYRVQPGGVYGVFLTSQRPELTLSIDNTFAEDKILTVRFDVVDFWNTIVSNCELPVRAAALACTNVSLKPVGISKTGFYAVHANVYDGAAKVASQTSAFCVTTPMEHPNKFFGFTQYDPSELPVSRILGEGVDALWIGWRTIEPAKGVFDFSGNDRMLAPFEGGDFRLIGAIDPSYAGEYGSLNTTPAWIQSIVSAWRKNHSDYKTNPDSAFPPEYYDYWRQYVSAVAQHYRGRIKIWQFIREIDWQLDAPGGTSHYAKMIAIGSKAIKQIDPTAIVGGIAASANDAQAGYPVARKTWDEAGDSLDGLFLHPYVQPCIYAPGQTPLGDEAGGLRRDLIAAQDLVREHHKSLVAIDENGIKVSSKLPVDSPWTKEAATAIARSLIIAKSVPMVGWYCSFLRKGESFGGDPQDPPGAYDYGYWIHGVPRASVAAYATCARMLDGATASSEFQCHRDLTGYIFSTPNGSLAALWTTRTEGVPLTVKLPSDTGLYDFMGDERPFSKSHSGATKLLLSHAPLFLISHLPAPVLASKLSTGTCPLPKVIAVARPGSYRTVDVYMTNQTPRPLKVSIEASLTGGARLLNQNVIASAPGGQMTCVSFPFDGVEAAGWTGAFAARISTPGSTPLVVRSNIALSAIHRMPSGTRPDGDLAEYASIAPIVLNSPDDVMCNAGQDAARKIWKGPDDLSMKTWLAWDDAFFYFAASVVDDQFVQEQTGSLIWKQDGFQLAFDTLANAVSPDVSGVPGPGDDFYQYGIALTKAGPQGYCWMAAKANAALAGKPTSFAPTIVRISPTLTDYEFAIPWSALAPFQPRPGAVMGFNLNYVDADAPVDSLRYWMQLTPGLSEGKNPAVYRQFVLSD